MEEKRIEGIKLENVRDDKNYVYKDILNEINSKILRLQDFKVIDTYHFDKAKALAEILIKPFVTGGILEDAIVICDDTNNTKITKDNRQFVLNIHVKAPGDKEFTILNFVRTNFNAYIK